MLERSTRQQCRTPSGRFTRKLVPCHSLRLSDTFCRCLSNQPVAPLSADTRHLASGRPSRPSSTFMATSPIVTALFRPPGGFFVRPEFYGVQGLNGVRGSGRRAKTSLSWDFVDRVSRLRSPTYFCLVDLFLLALEQTLFRFQKTIHGQLLG